MKAVLVSFFGTNNIGDLLISDQLYKKAKSHFEEVYRIDYLTGKEIKEENSLEIPSYSKQNIKKQKSLKTKVSEFLEKTNLLFLNYYYLSNFQKFNLSSFEERITDADVLIIGGGNMIFDMYKRTLGANRFDQYVSIAKNQNKIVFANSLGIGPFQTVFQVKSATRALNKCDYVTFRDESSHKLYEKYNELPAKQSRVSIDPVFMIENQSQGTTDTNVIGINIINNPVYTKDKSKYKKVKEGYIKLIQHMAKNYDSKIVLFSTETRDYEVIEDIFSEVSGTKNVSVRKISDINSLLSLYNDLSLLIGTRMHSMIIAYTQHIPVVGLSWQPKVKAMFDIIDERDSCFDLLLLQDKLKEIDNCVNNKIIASQEEKLRYTLEVLRKKDYVNESIYGDIKKSKEN